MKAFFTILISGLIPLSGVFAQKGFHSTQDNDNYNTSAYPAGDNDVFRITTRSSVIDRDPIVLSSAVATTVQKKESGYHLFYEDGSPLVKAHTRHNRLHNTWQSWYTSNRPCDKGFLKKGIPDGEWLVWYPNGKLRYLRNYSADLLDRIKSEWIRQPRNSFYPITVIAQRDIHRAAWYTGTQHTFFTPPSQEIISVDDVLRHNGKEKQHYMPPFTEGLLHGLYANYFSNGLVKDSGFYKYGLREGDWLENSGDDSPVAAKGFYLHGVKTGTWRYYRMGKLSMLREFDRKGKEVFRKSFS